MRAPCELIIWYVLPAIRRELARSMIEDFGLTQRAAANKLGLTDAAISQYLSAKRGKIQINDPVVLKEIRRSAKRMAQGNRDIVLRELCRVCSKAKKRGILKEMHACEVGCGKDGKAVNRRN